MKLIRKLLFLNSIYFKQTTLQIMIVYGLVAIFVWLLSGILYDAYPPLAILLVVIYNYFLLRTILRTVIVELRLKQSTLSPIFSATGRISPSSINYELETIDQARVISVSKHTKLYDAVFNFYRKTKYGEYLSKQVYYTVFEIQLKRILPHIIFDSKTAKKRQFKYLFLKAQRISVQGEFDDYFDTYVPQTYHIDSLSFISPEVMEALIAAKDFDIEIIDDKLLLYAPLISLKRAQRLVELGGEVAKQIDDNIDTYRDSRLSGQERIHNVTPFARTLLKSPAKYVPTLVISGVISIAAIYLSLTVSKEFAFNEYSVLAYMIFITNLWTIIKLKRKNDELLRQFHFKNKANADAANQNKLKLTRRV